jgi:cobalamin biosynthesis protein CobC
LGRAAKENGIALANWLDLSTGINPESYPLESISPRVWHRLPESDDELVSIAATYYGNSNLLPVAGSQAAIQTLPLLRNSIDRVTILTPSYNEHAHAWSTAGHQVRLITALHTEQIIAQIDSLIDETDVLLICNPNNPTGTVVPTAHLEDWGDRLVARGGSLIVDEAFIDATPELSMTPRCGAQGLIVLRSLGKFFGLAGARVGFVFSDPALMNALANRLGPWAVSGPSRFAAIMALGDERWQNETRAKLTTAKRRLISLLANNNITVDGATAFFAWTQHDRADQLHLFLARRGILTRLFKNPLSIRFGLAGCETEWERLDEALQEWGKSEN